MKIIGFGLKRLFGEKKDFNNKKINLSQNINITNVQKERLEITGEDAITITFVFSVNYSEDAGKIEIEGNILIIPDKEDLKEFSKTLKEKSIPDKYKPHIFNFIMAKCNIKALSIEDELNLPPHIPMPRLAPEGERKQ
jgi:hypothetical protein